MTVNLSVITRLMCCALCMFSLDGIAAARTSKAPASIRQIYADKTYADISCMKAIRNTKCIFTLLEGRMVRKYKFDISKYGYMTFLDQFHFFESVKDEPFLLSIEVDCLDEDLKLIPGGFDNEVHCNLNLSPAGHELRALRVEVMAIIGGTYFSKTRLISP